MTGRILGAGEAERIGLVNRVVPDDEVLALAHAKLAGAERFFTFPNGPEANPYFDLVIRSNENCNGFFWREDYRKWFAEHGLEIHLATPAGIFWVRNERQALSNGGRGS